MKRLLSELLEALIDRRRSRRLPPPSEHQVAKKKSHLLAFVAEQLLSASSDAAKARTTLELLSVYSTALSSERLQFLEIFACSFGPDHTRVDDAVARCLAQGAVDELYSAAKPRRQELLKRINSAKRGAAALVRMREDLLVEAVRRPALQTFDAASVRLFSSWFNRDPLFLRRLDWTTPANMLAKIISCAAMREVKSWDDLQRFLEPEDRRCFAFFHPELAEEPQIIVKVSLTDCIPSSLDMLVSDCRKNAAVDRIDTAVIHSISFCRVGLKCIALGDFQIDQLVKELAATIPFLTRFVALSPIPGFRRWLAEVPEANKLIQELEAEKRNGPLPIGCSRIQAKLCAFVARYSRAGNDAQGKPLDAEANFHLANGARFECVNWSPDGSPRSWEQSFGAMVTDRYELSDISKNLECYARAKQVIASDAVRSLLTGPPLAMA